MKLLFEAEDCMVGIAVGILMVGLSGFYFTLPELNLLWAFVFLFSLVFTVLDVFYTFLDFGEDFLIHVLLLLNNIFDALIEVALAAKYFGLNFPYISDFINSFLDKPEVLFGLGIFFVVSSIFWLIYTPFMK